MHKECVGALTSGLVRLCPRPTSISLFRTFYLAFLHYPPRVSAPPISLFPTACLFTPRFRTTHLAFSYLPFRRFRTIHSLLYDLNYMIIIKRPFYITLRSNRTTHGQLSRWGEQELISTHSKAFELT